ncbi:MAG: TetM/TetW/TetO/TetS family tetracycline resistance ribosomal protection protein [Hespellia sp.]|nr:TetM/TetW/TetO/TetS family tetracycline resistance ribosomal protection protein [Hespellia sp.]
MEEKTEVLTEMKQLTIGILAHVDAGKTTLSEGILYLSNTIRTLGRVDNQDSFLDTDEMERQRGITIFSKQAVFDTGKMHVTLLDTPGHVDFSAEMERTLQVLDYAILVISGADGVQGHTMTLWRLLKEYQIPVFLFINKMDQEGTDRDAVLAELKELLDENCVDFTESSEDLLENIAMCEDVLFESYMEHGTITTDEIADCIFDRNVYPCFFGSALKLQGVDTLLKGVERYTKMPEYQDDFGAKVFKISRDEQGGRLTHLKMTGGTLKVKDLVGEDKVNQIRIYSGMKYETVNEITAGSVCAVTGLTKTEPGQGLGIEPQSQAPVLSPVLMYRILLPEDCDPHHTFLQFKQLEEEEPQLNLIWDDKLKEIQAQLMGEIQIEILKNLIWKRFHLAVSFGPGNILYKETIADTVEGVGHYEPLRHYAEVHLLMEPVQRGSGMQFATDCSEDMLDRNWQRLILTHLEEREHKGVLVGGAVTDMKITVIGGRAHLKHTEGGDFRQATYRAVRQGLMQAESVLLEPYYSFRLELPTEYLGRALSDIERMSGKAEAPQLDRNLAVLTGTAPVSRMQGYQTEVVAYTKGLGRLLCTAGGYLPCHNQEEIIEEVQYDAESDLENPPSSVFCAHGAGFVVQWNQIVDYMHVEGRLLTKKKQEEYHVGSFSRTGSATALDDFVDDYVPKYNPIEYEKNRAKTVLAQKEQNRRTSERETVPEYLLVDGYNIIFAWETLRELAAVNLDSARDRLIDIMCNYQGHKGMNLILVFDAYKVKENPGSDKKHYNIQIVFTKEAETADMYIEKFAHQMGRKYTVTVATSDGVEQVIIRGQGCLLMSARELEEDVELTNRQIREQIGRSNLKHKNYSLAHAIDNMTTREGEEK